MRSNQSGFVVLKPALRPAGGHLRPWSGLLRSACSGSSLLVLLLALLGGWRQARAAAPTNDICSGAENIPTTSFAYFTAITDITLATTNGDPPSASCVFGAISHSIWYRFTPKDTTNYTISSCADAPTATTLPDTVMAIYTSSAGCAGATNELPATATSIGCSDDSCGPGFSQAAITTQLFADTTYYIVVWEYGTANPAPGSSAVQLRISKTSPPGNDTGINAMQVLLNSPVLGTTILAHDDYELPPGSPCFPVGQPASTASGRDVVYSFTAPEAGNYSIKVNNYKINCWDKFGDCYDLVLYVASALPAGPAPATVTTCLAAANRNAASRAEEILCLPMTANQQIYIFVDETQLSPEGSSFVLEVTACTRETDPNDSWTNANLLTFGMEGSIGPLANDVDYYSLGAFPAGSRLFAMVDGSAANVTDFKMRVIAASATSTNVLEYDAGNNDDLFGGLSSNVAGTPLTSVPVFLRINGSQKAEPYRLYAVVQPPLASATPEIEPNNTTADALLHMADNNYFYGSLTSGVPGAVSSDVDVYAFTVEAADGLSDVIYVGLDSDPTRTNTPIDAKLELLDESGNVLVTVDDENSTASTTLTTNSLTATTPFSPAEALVYRTLADGTYYARVSISPRATALNGAGDYLLSISRNGFIGSSGFNTTPALANTAVTSPIYQSDHATVTGSIIDYDINQTHQVVLNWGDGSPVTTTNLAAGVANFNLWHNYATPITNAPISLLLKDAANATATTNLTVTVQSQPASPHLLSITPLPNGHQLLQLQGSPGVSYRIQISPALNAWMDFTNSTAGPNGLFQIEDPTSPLPPQRFYRALWP